MSTFSTQWELLLADKMSGPLGKIAARGGQLEKAFSRVTEQAQRLQSLSLEARLRRQFEGTGKSVDALNLRLERLQMLRDKSFDPARIRRFNDEISKTKGQIAKLQTEGSGGGLLSRMSNSSLPVLGALGVTPQLAGAAALGTAAVSSFNKADEWNAMMGKINVTAELSQTELAKLDTKLRQIGKNSSVDMAQIPAAFERIISATGDVDSALALLQPTLKASAANMTDVEQVAGAAVSVMNSVKGASPAQVFDVLTETMKAGNVQFRDLAQYLPKLLPFANQAGVSFTDAAGAFAFMTKTGLSAEASTTQLSAAFRALADPERIAALRQIGVHVFDAQGKMRKLVDVAGDLEKRLSGLSDQRKAEVLASLNLDSEAASGLSIMAGKTGLLRQVVGQVESSEGALDKSVRDSDNGRQRRQRAMNTITEAQLAIGEALVPAMEILAKVAGDLLAPLLHGLAPVLSILGELLGKVVTPVMALLNPLVQALGELLAPVAEIIGMLLVPTLGALGLLLQLLAPPLKLLSWLLGLLRDVLKWVKDLLQPVINFFNDLANTIKAFIDRVMRWAKRLLFLQDNDQPGIGVASVVAAANKSMATAKVSPIPQKPGGTGMPTAALPAAGLDAAGIKGVAAGGERPRNIYVNIGSLNEQMTVHMSSNTDALNVRRQMSELLVDVVRDAEYAIGN
jgi:TP901 family phage tail tape measure protein